MTNLLADAINRHLAARRWSFKRLASAAQVPQSTVHRWTRGEVIRVHQWQHLARVASALGLDRKQTNELLEAGGQNSLDVIARVAEDEADRELLASWATLTAQHNLPVRLTSFVGRQQEMDDLHALLTSETARLVTLTGAGGSGKTRLALATANDLLNDFEEVWFVDLATVHDPELVMPVIAQTLGVQVSSGETAQQALERHLRNRHVLLVLDNFEQVVAAAVSLTQLLWIASRVRALVTSRIWLNVRGEHLLVVNPLPLPILSFDTDELMRNPAVSLFQDRARAVDSTFFLTPINTPIVADLCIRVDGLPLGIELVAAQVRTMTFEEIQRRFPTGLALASQGHRDLSERQQNLHATVAWSYDLFPPPAQLLLAILGVFANGFTQMAAESVCTTLGLEIDVGQGLRTLVDQSLIRRRRPFVQESRYEILETIREFAQEKLTEHGTVEAAHQAHADFYVDLARRVHQRESGQADGQDVLAREQENFRAALAWCSEQGHGETGLRLTLALVPLLHVQDQLPEARSWLETFMTVSDQVPPGLRAGGLLWQGLMLLRGTGDVLAASPLFDEALVLFRLARDPIGTCEALQAVGDADRHQDAWTQAKQRYVESMELAMQMDNPFLLAHAYMGLAFCAQEENQFAEANRYWELTLVWAKRSGNRATVALALNSLGEMARYWEDWATAKDYYQQSLELAQELDSKFRIAMALHNLGYIAYFNEEPDASADLFSESLLLYDDGQYLKGVAECLAGLGMVEASTGRSESAATLCGASESILNALATRLDTLDRADYEKTLATLRERVGEKLPTLLDVGRSMSMADAVTFAISVPTIE